MVPASGRGRMALVILGNHGRWVHCPLLHGLCDLRRMLRLSFSIFISNNSLPRCCKTSFIIRGKDFGAEGALGMHQNALVLQAQGAHCIALSTPLQHVGGAPTSTSMLLQSVRQHSVQFFMDCQRNKLLHTTKWNWHFKSKTHDISITCGTRYHHITCHLVNIRAGGAKRNERWIAGQECSPGSAAL